jgi:hypothetical protein
MGTDEAAERAIAEINQTALGGRTLAVNEARPRPERAGGGGFGGRGGGGGGFGRKGGGSGRGGRGSGRREPRW